MKKYTLFAALLLAVVLGAAAVQGQPALIDYVPEKPGAPTLYNDATPKVAVRYDDGRAVPNEIMAFLRRGIPVTLSINTSTIGSSAASFTWADIRELQRVARNFGTTLHIAQHTDNNFDGVASGDLTHDQVVAELSTETIERELGYKPRVLVIPGNTGVTEWFRSNKRYVQSVADSLGLWYIDSNRPSAGQSDWSNFFPTFAALNAYDASLFSAAVMPYQYAKPGLGIDRASIHSLTLDLSNYIVERSQYTGTFGPFERTSDSAFESYGQREFTGVIPPNADEWTLAGQGADAAAEGINNKTWAYFYTSALVTNHGFQVVLHDSTVTDGDDPNISGISGSELVGQFSPDHVAWTLAMLERKGFIELVGIEEWCEWATGDWAPGTDLINNPRMLSPQIAVGDTIGPVAEYGYVAGFGSMNARKSTFSATGHSQIFNMQGDDSGNLAQYVRRVSVATADNPYYALGDSVTGVRGRPGGAMLRADTANNAPERLGWIMGGLKPGARYMASIDIFVPDGVNPGAEEFHLASWIRSYKLDTAFEAEFTAAYRDTLIEWRWKDNTINLNLDNDDDNRWGTFTMPISVPDWPLGETLAGEGFGSTTESNDATLFSPLSELANEGYLTDSQWAWTFLMSAQGAGVIVSNPRFIYLGE